jgi:predicted ribosome quality control (RQC) complex YloA/Tae2 family protein
MYTEIFNINYRIEIGRNQMENDRLIKTSRQNSIWFHLKDQPSPHGIITLLNHSSLDKEVIYRTAQLVKSFSKAKNLNNVLVEYIPLSKIKTTNIPGTVILKKTPQYVVV